jgi:hypothetical protein
MYLAKTRYPLPEAHQSVVFFQSYAAQLANLARDNDDGRAIHEAVQCWTGKKIGSNPEPKSRHQIQNCGCEKCQDSRQCDCLAWVITCQRANGGAHE